MRREELDYDLPPERIAQHPVEPRDASRLLVLDRGSGRIEHAIFREIGRYLRTGDVLVLNDTRVIPARFFARRPGGGRVEGLFLREDRAGWRALLRPSRRVRIGQVLDAEDDALKLHVVQRYARGEWRLRPEPPVAAIQALGRIGRTPLPPYIERAAGPVPEDALRYQTVYARRAGAVAAPTAGLHFTGRLLAELRRAGVGLVFVTLHVGLGTFAPIEVEDLRAHRMHSEWFEAPLETLQALHERRRRGGRIVAVGTTSARVLESLPQTLGREAPPAPQCGWTDLFIYPPYAFRNVDALVTNFHLPGSTLLALVMALAGIEAVRRAYREAIAQGYRFYSYGDAMLIV